ESFLPPQHRHRQLAKAFGVDLDLALRCHPDDPFGIPAPIEQAWRVPEDRGVLLQEDAYSAEEHVTAADVALVGARRCVDRRENDVVPAREELRRERVVAEAAAAIH